MLPGIVGAGNVSAFVLEEMKSWERRNVSMRECENASIQEGRNGGLTMRANAPLVQTQESWGAGTAVEKETNGHNKEQGFQGKQVNRGKQVNQGNRVNQPQKTDQENQAKRGRPRKAEAAGGKTEKGRTRREERDTLPFCGEEDCHAWRFGRCTALWDNDFGGKRCPFYKPMGVCQKERRDSLTRMIQAGRMDLVGKYKTVLSDLGVLDMEDGYADRASDDLARYSEQYLQELLAQKGTQTGLPGQPERDGQPEQSAGCAQSGQFTQDGGDEWDDEWDDE